MRVPCLRLNAWFANRFPDPGAAPQLERSSCLPFIHLSFCENHGIVELIVTATQKEQGQGG